MSTPCHARLLSGLLVLLLAGCSSLAPRPELPDQNAVALAQGTALDDLIDKAEAAHPGQSGFRLVREGPEAFAIRAHTALMAGRSLDVQTYIWKDDATGAFLAYRAIEAADRGVKVRLLVDDMDARGKNYKFAALAAHPNIEVRMFNPFGSRTGALQFAFEALGSFSRINRRMHNKSWIADNRIAIVGGRNLGNEYFGASKEVNFVDLDFDMGGPVVGDASAALDRYWTPPAAYRMALLAPDDVTTAALDTLRKSAASRAAVAQDHPFAVELRNSDAIQRLVAGDWPMHWTSRYLFVADDPAKALDDGGGPAGSQVLAMIGPMVKDAKQHVSIISPYFVPGKQGSSFLVSQVEDGTGVRVLTNSLAANDVAMVYGGYSRSRPALLKGGVQIWELKPLPGAQSAVYYLTVGSKNQDPRSAFLDGETSYAVAGPWSLVAYSDFLLLMAATTWVESEPELTKLIPVEEEKARKIGRLIGKVL